MYATVIGDRWWKVEAWQRNQWVLADQGVLLVWIRLDNSSSTPYLFRDCISHIALGMFNLLPSGAGLPAQKLTLDTISQAANESSEGKEDGIKCRLKPSNSSTRKCTSLAGRLCILWLKMVLPSLLCPSMRMPAVL